MGSLPPNAILFTRFDGSGVFLKSIKEDGSNETVLASFNGDTIKAVAANPNTANQFAFVNFDSATIPSMKLYRGNSALNPATSTQLTTTVFEDVLDVQFSPDGQYVLFSAVRTGDANYKLFVVPAAGGTETILDNGGDFSVCPDSANRTVVYSKDNPSGTSSDLYTVNYVTGAGKTALTTLNTETFTPSWNRAATKVYFSSQQPVSGGSGTQTELFTVTYPGGVTAQVTTTDAVFESGFGVNEGESKVSYINFTGSDTDSGVYVMNADGTGVLKLVGSTGIGISTYFTNSQGRMVGGQPFHFTFGKRKLRR